MKRVPHRILVVDDESTIRFALREFLLANGYLVDCASEREEAEALIANVEYAAVIADLRLLGSDSREGLDVIAAARDRSRCTRIVLLSAYGSAALEAEAHGLGADLVLRKPRPLADIARCLGALLQPPEARP
jgi:DNA-binding response OmpR family regulator